VQAHDSVHTAVSGADLVFTLLNTPDAAEEVYLGGGGVLENMHPGCVLADMTLMSQQQAKEMYALASVHDCLYVDAPVDGGLRQFEAGELRVFLGGEHDSLTVLRPALAELGVKVLEMGLPGNGAAAKCASVLARAGMMMNLVEVLAYAQGCGLGGPQTRELLRNSPLITDDAARMGALILDEDFQTGAGLGQFTRDLQVVLDSASDMELAFPMLETAHQLYDLLAMVGGSTMGLQALALVYRDEATCTQQGLDWSLAHKVMDVYEQAAGSVFDDDEYYDEDYLDDDDCDCHHHDFDDRHNHGDSLGYFSAN
jgi:3-hydroxyisobutyrate dehydrogenase